MTHEPTAPAHGLEQEISIADGVHAVPADPLETEFARDGFAVDVEDVPREGAGAEGAAVQILEHVGEALVVGGEEEAVGEEEVGPADWLGALEVGVAWEEEGCFGGGAGDDDAEEGGQVGLEGLQLVAEPETLLDVMVSLGGEGKGGIRGQGETN